MEVEPREVLKSINPHPLRNTPSLLKYGKSDEKLGPPSQANFELLGSEPRGHMRPIGDTLFVLIFAWTNFRAFSRRS